MADDGSDKGKGGLAAKAAVVLGGGVVALLVAAVVVLVCLVVLIVAVLQSDYGWANCTAGGTSWVEWAKSIAKDDSHGYSQRRRDGNPDYDCSSLVWYALRNAGFDVGSVAFATGGMDSMLTKAGFTRMDYKDVSSLQTGDIVWATGHTEIYVGDGMFVGAHHDENGGIEGSEAGDQTGDEISVTASLSAAYSRVYRAPSGAGTQAVSGGTSDSGWEGMTVADARSRWKDVDYTVCDSYPPGQCTWGACVRAYHLGWKQIGRHWGNGGDWARSAAAAGYQVTSTAPVAGAIASFPPGVQGAAAVYGHVAVVESVDTAAGKVTISEMNVKGALYSKRVLPIVSGASYILPKDVISGAASSATCTANESDGDRASVEDAKSIARRKVKEHGWDDTQAECLVELWDHESGWRWDAENPSSGAYGIPQALPGSKMASSGQDWKTNAATQIDWGLQYIQQRYQTPCGAWGVWQSRSPHWY
ncbi:CHAP domain protein [Bifidobacterium saguini DSM 23967]|uniref:CHAP domain protein n=1 Tax=Bifidobacterium saguini DSM 23967 TaxID=1437607 RepID=A0A087D6U1_9BIFI|nr:CHAP domain-containing protein [Bifidobacterium saguini]KFI91241.1 CHAP domain protein [Bifidobacterium saguini DSM 23967]